MATGHSNLATARRYLEALEQGVDSARIAEFFTPDVRQEEFPNRLLPAGARRDLGAIPDGAAQAKQLMAAQRFEVRHAVAEGDRVAMEAFWTGTLRAGMGSLPTGGAMRAHFAVFLDFRDGEIVGQRNYDCFEPW